MYMLFATRLPWAQQSPEPKEWARVQLYNNIAYILYDTHIVYNTILY